MKPEVMKSIVDRAMTAVVDQTPEQLLQGCTSLNYGLEFVQQTMNDLIVSYTPRCALVIMTEGRTSTVPLDAEPAFAFLQDVTELTVLILDRMRERHTAVVAAMAEAKDTRLN